MIWRKKIHVFDITNIKIGIFWTKEQAVNFFCGKLKSVLFFVVVSVTWSIFNCLLERLETAVTDCVCVWERERERKRERELSGCVCVWERERERKRERELSGSLFSDFFRTPFIISTQAMKPCNENPFVLKDEIGDCLPELCCAPYSTGCCCLQVNLYLGLFVFCAFVLYDTQLIVEKRRRGDDDYIWWVNCF